MIKIKTLRKIEMENLFHLLKSIHIKAGANKFFNGERLNPFPPKKQSKYAFSHHFQHSIHSSQGNKVWKENERNTDGKRRNLFVDHMMTFVENNEGIYKKNP